MMDRRIINAYVTEAAFNGGHSELEGYVCEQLGVPEGHLRDQYNAITDKINANNKGLTNETFVELICAEYHSIIESLELLQTPRRNYTDYLLLEQQLIKMEQMLEQIQEEEKKKDFCIGCGKRITDWEDVEYTDKEVILTYRCPCGTYAEQHHKLVYGGTKVIEIAEAANE